jgi:hypothetical protein
MVPNLPEGEASPRLASTVCRVKREWLEDDPKGDDDLTDEECRLCDLYDDALEAATIACCSGWTREPLTVSLSLERALGFW